MSLIMAAIKRPHHAPRSTFLLPRAGSIAGSNNINIGIGIGISISNGVSITAALHGASRLRNSTPLSKTHHSNAARRWGLLCAHSGYRYPKQVHGSIGQFSVSLPLSLSLSQSVYLYLFVSFCICYTTAVRCAWETKRAWKLISNLLKLINTHQNASALEPQHPTSTLTPTPTLTRTLTLNTKPEMKCLRLI